MDNIDKFDQAGFILAHGKEICYAGKDIANLKKLNARLHAQLVGRGAVLTQLTDYNKTRDMASMCGPDVVLLLEQDAPEGYNTSSWSTLFVVPEYSQSRDHKPWRDQNQRDCETFFWNEDGDSAWWISYPLQGEPAKYLKPWSENADKLFQHQILGIHPDLAIHWDRIFPMYFGADSQYAPYRLPFLELLHAIKKAIEKGKDKFIFSNADEALQPHSIGTAHRLIRALDFMPKSSFFMLTAALDGTDSYNKLCGIMGIEPMMQIISGHRFENVVKDSMYMDYPSRSQDFTEHPVWKDREYHIGKRTKKLLCFNRMPRWQRARMVGFLFEHDLVKDSFVSFDLSNHAEGFSNKDAWLLENNNQLDEELKQEPYMHNIYKNWSRLPLVLNRTVERDNPVDINDDDLQYFNDSYFSVVNETNFYHCLGDVGTKPISCVHTDGVFISEKLYKPIAHRHPFVVAGINRTLEYLRKAGYKTFDGIINEEYDQIEDDELRLQALEEEVLRLANLTDDEWLVLQVQLKPIIDHNYNHLLSIKKLNTTDYDLVGEYFKG